MIVRVQIEQQNITLEGGRRACEEGGKNLACVCHREKQKGSSEAQALSLTW